MTTYVVISRLEDEPTIELIPAAALLTMLNHEGSFAGYKILKEIPSIDLQEFPSKSLLIIEGKIIVPKVKTVVKEFEL